MKCVTLLIIGALTGCATPPARFVQVTELVSNPSGYEGQDVETCGWLVVEMETCTIAPSKHEDLSAIWVLPSTKTCVPSNWFPGKEGWARVSGRLQTGGGYGHSGMYKSILVGGRISKLGKKCGSE